MSKLLSVAAAGVLLAASDAALADRSGEDVFKAACTACHTAGVAGAPKVGDRAAWAPRIAKGPDALLATVKSGKNAMPPKGACADCSDAELEAAVEYMTSQSQ